MRLLTLLSPAAVLAALCALQRLEVWMLRSSPPRRGVRRTPPAPERHRSTSDFSQVRRNPPETSAV
jgi:hypothetical protein